MLVRVAADDDEPLVLPAVWALSVDWSDEAELLTSDDWPLDEGLLVSAV